MVLRTTLLLFLVLPCLAQTSRLDTILQDGVLVVGTTADYRPFTYREEGELTGYVGKMPSVSQPWRASTTLE